MEYYDWINIYRKEENPIYLNFQFTKHQYNKGSWLWIIYLLMKSK